MANLKFDLDIYLILLVIVMLLLGLACFIIYSIFFYRKKQALNIVERDKLKVSFQKELLQTQLEVQEQTMQTIGADLHDNIGQLLSLTSLTLNSIELDNTVKAQQKIDAAINLTIRSIKEMRLLGKLLQGDQLIVMGLSAAITYEINWIEKSGQYKVNYVNDGEMPASNSPDKDLILFRILQEILNNIMKHSKATEININLEYRDTTLQLTVADNGIGFDLDNPPADQNGMGLQNIRKRAGIIGGNVSISSSPGAGAIITVTTPYP